MSTPQLSPIDYLDRLEQSFTKIHKSTELTDICLRSISKPETAFVKPPSLLGKLWRWLSKTFSSKEQVSSSIEETIRVRLYDNTSNLEGIHTLFQRALKTADSQDPEKLRRILSFALSLDLVPQNTEKSCLNLLVENLSSSHSLAHITALFQSIENKQTFADIALKKIEEFLDANENISSLSPLLDAVSPSLSKEQGQAVLHLIEARLKRETSAPVLINELVQVPTLAKSPTAIDRLTQLLEHEKDLSHIAPCLLELSKEFSPQACQQISKALCQRLRASSPEELYILWHALYEQLGDASVLLQAKDFSSALSSLKHQWKNMTTAACQKIERLRSLKKLHTTIEQTHIDLEKQFSPQIEQLKELVDASPNHLKKPLQIAIFLALGNSHQKLYQTIAQRHLEVALQEVRKASDRDSITSLLEILRDTRAHLKQMPKSIVQKSLLTTIKEHVKTLSDKLKSLPPPPAQVTINQASAVQSVAQTALGPSISSAATQAIFSAAALGIGLYTDSTILSTVAIPTALSAASTLAQPITSLIDKQCDRLPQTMRTPVKATYRLLAASAAFCAAKATFNYWTAVSPKVEALSQPEADTVAPTSEKPAVCLPEERPSVIQELKQGFTRPVSTLQDAPLEGATPPPAMFVPETEPVVAEQEGYFSQFWNFAAQEYQSGKEGAQQVGAVAAIGAAVNSVASTAMGTTPESGASLTGHQIDTLLPTLGA